MIITSLQQPTQINQSLQLLINLLKYLFGLSSQSNLLVYQKFKTQLTQKDIQIFIFMRLAYYAIYYLYMNILKIISCIFIASLCLLVNIGHGKKIVNVPLDQRFTTRIAFLNMAKITPHQIETLPDALLPSLKQYSSPQQIISWTQRQAATSQLGIISLQSLLYGSLIASRISNDTQDSITKRLYQIVQMIKANPQWKVYTSAVVMRIPHYNGDFQQPWYWANYGQLLYNYSFYCDKYNSTKNSSDLQACQSAKNKIPENIIQQFIWRRTRNHNILLKLLSIFNTQRNLFKRLYITLDDSAQFGYNAQEAQQIINKVKQYNLSYYVSVYPGADEVSLTLLSALSVDETGEGSPYVAMIFRNTSTTYSIPKYQGLPMIQTLKNQIYAAGGTPINGSILKRGNITLLVNNFDQQVQMEAPSQGPSNQKDYNVFNNFVCYPNKTEIIGFADNRYCNGADVFFVNYALNKISQCRNITQWAYAGWNTNGNTLGTVVANTILLWVYRNYKIDQQIQNSYKQIGQYVSPCKSGDLICANSYFNSLRILQDKDWQAILRQLTRNYIYQTPGDNINDLTNDLQFYQKMVFKSMRAKLNQLKSLLKLNFTLSGVYFPWNRTFEIGLYGELDNKGYSNHLIIEQ